MKWLNAHIKEIVWFGLGLVVGFLVAGWASSAGVLSGF